MTLLLILLQISDYITTNYAISKLGLVERNPVVNWGMRVWGMPMGLLIAKGVGVLAALLLQGSFILTAALIAVYIYVIHGNLKAIQNELEK